MALCCIAVMAQNSQEEFKARYDRQVRAVGASGVGVETIIDRWEEAFPDDPAAHEARYKFYLAKATSSTVVKKDSKRYLGKEPVLSLPDSSGKEVFFFEDTVFVDSLFAAGQSAIDRAIALDPSELAYRVDKVTSLMLYEKESPDMTSQELLKLIDYQKTTNPEWTYLGLPVDEDTFKQTIQEYCLNLYRYATPGSYEAFRTISEAMLKLYPKDTYCMSNIGTYWLVYKQNNRQALKWYQKVLKIKPDDYAAAKNCVIIARRDKNIRLEKKYLPVLIATAPTESERASCRARLDALSQKK